MSKTGSAAKTTIRTRTKAPKVKTGCITCKIRRVKCDEGKPSCLRCQKFGIECDGYLQPNVRWRHVQSHRRPLLPASLHQPQAGPKFNEEEEYRCFQQFRDDTIHCLAGSFTDNLWAGIISQASENEPFVRNCVIAIGALSKASVLPRASLGTDEISERNNPMFEYALKQYGKALGAMRKALSDEKQDLRRALIACLLVFCFESYVGNQVAAITHAQSGVSLLHQWQTSKKAGTSTSVQSNSNIEDELVGAFTRLDLQVSILLDTRELQFHRLIKEECCVALQDMPTFFKSIDEARPWCELLMRWNYHFRAESMAIGKAQELEMKEVLVKWEDSMDTPMGATVLHDPKEIPVALFPEYRAHALKTQQWFAAFEPLFRELKSSPRKDLVSAIQLKVQAKMSYVTLASAFFTLETGYDAFLPEFRDIVSLVASISKVLIRHHSEKRLVYHFNGGFIPPLFLVATKCRDRVLRRQAIALLYSAPLREGVFDSICVAKMSQWIVAIEEEGIDEGEIPDHRRFRVRRSNIDLPMRRAQLQGTQLKKADDSEPEWKEVVLKW